MIVNTFHLKNGFSNIKQHNKKAIFFYNNVNGNIKKTVEEE